MHLGLMLTIPMMFDPQLPALQWVLRLAGAGPDEDPPLSWGIDQMTRRS
jgi:hypothetical protein